MKLQRYLPLLLPLALISCTQTESSPWRHARHYLYQSDDGFNPNFYTNKADSTRMMAPFFAQFYDMGVKDRAAGKPEKEARQQASQFRDVKYLKSIQGTTNFAGKTYTDSDALSPDALRALGNAISGTYMDGYAGIK